MLYQIDVAPYMEILELPVAAHPERAELVLQSKQGKRIASVVVEAGGTVYQLRYPTTKSYGGPDTASAIATLMLRAGERSETLPYLGSAEQMVTEINDLAKRYRKPA